MTSIQPTLFDEARLFKQLQSQKNHSWDLESRMDWKKGVDLSKPLLPLDEKNLLFPGASPEERLVISQLMGLIVASTISQLENVANELKETTWEKVLDRFPVNPEFYNLGEEFYKEEAKHSKAFSRYIDSFANALGIDPEELRNFLPQARNSISKKLYELNSMMGGMAMWWLIAAIEEESILIYRYLQPFKTQVDPLYYQIHRAHFEEEARHKSYALMMLNLFEEFNSDARKFLFGKVDFLIAECLNLTWTFHQLLKVKRLRKLKNHHPFFKTLDSILIQLEGRNGIDIIRELLNSTPYISNTLRLGEYRHVNEYLNHFGAARIPWTRKSELGVLCIQ